MHTITVLSPDVSWRVYEREMCEKWFGGVNDRRPENIFGGAMPEVVYWKLASESMTGGLLNRVTELGCVFAERGAKQINNPGGWLNVHCKDKCFEAWRVNGIPCPEWFTFEVGDEIRDMVDYPGLVRINNGTGGRFSWLVSSEGEMWEAMPKLLDAFKHAKAGIPANRGVARKMMWVKYYDTGTERHNLSYRIIVAGEKVVAGYARLSPKDDWCCITKKFRQGDQQDFIYQQRECERWCKLNEKLIVKAVRCLGLNFQGVDVIRKRDNGEPLFIEVQPGFSVGYANHPGWKPPFFNPTYPEELVEWLVRDPKELEKVMPWYYENWLDKRNMFDLAFGALKESLCQS